MNRPKIIVLGARGMLGSDMVKAFSGDYDISAADIDEVDITDAKAVKSFIEKLKPEIVINCTGYTAVDLAETEKDKAFAINADGAANIAQACKLQGAKFVHFSTDYVFDGTKKGAYTENDTCNPLSVYGKSKLEGEVSIQLAMSNFLIIRTSWLFGKNGKNFVSTIVRLAREKDELRVVSDQVGSPTYTVDLARATKKLIEKNAIGLVHVTNSGTCSWFEFAQAILKAAGIEKVKVTPITSEEFNAQAKRPANSILDSTLFTKLTGVSMPSWQDALKRFTDEKK